MSQELEAAAVAAMQELVGEAGVTEDAGIMAAQIERATRILARPPVAFGALWEKEPSSHAAALLRLAPEEKN
jgi:hypothetical protein